jgi:hypothetical protein
MILPISDLRHLTSGPSGSVDREHLEAENVLGPIYKAFGEKLWRRKRGRSLLIAIRSLL